MNDTDAFLQSLQHGDINGRGNATKYQGVDYYAGSSVNSNNPSPRSHNSVGAPVDQENENNMSITPESFRSSHSRMSDVQKAQVSLPQQQNILRESPFDFSDYDEQVSFVNIPQQAGQTQQPNQAQVQMQMQTQQNNSSMQNGSFASPEDMVKSEFSPVMLHSNSNSNSSQASSVQNGLENDFDAYSNNDYLAKDEFAVGIDFDDMASGDNFAGLTTKTGKRRKEKTSHNIIEKKYRTSINDKIFQLRDIVPTLNVAYKKYAGIPLVAQDSIDLDGLEPAKKLNKASILMKTIEYIKHLETKCRAYKMENQHLKSNVPTPESLRPNSSSGRASSQNREQRLQGPNSYNVDTFSRINQDNNMSNNLGTDMGMETEGSNDYASKFLMGGLALTMGASCFGDNGDIGSARALFAMPIFQFSPGNGFIMSNTNGVINLQSSIFALFKIGLIIATLLYIINGLFANSRSKCANPPKDDDMISIIPIKDTVQFDSYPHLTETLKKTFIVNKLKYRLNSMERVESKIAKCFAIKLYFNNSKFPWNYLSRKFVEKKWIELKSQVDRANLNSKGLLNSGIEWNMITNVMNSERRFTLDNEVLLKELSRNENELELKDFLAQINSYILNDTKEILLNGMMEDILRKETSTELEETLEEYYNNKLVNNKLLKSVPEDCVTLGCLLVPTKQRCDKLSKLIDINRELRSENLLEQQLVLYCSVMRSLNREGQIDQCNKWSKKMPIFDIINMGKKEKAQKLSLVSLTAIFLMLKSLSANLSHFNNEALLKIEESFAHLRIWLGCEKGGKIKFSIRSLLIDFCIAQTKKCGELIKFDIPMKELDDDDTEFEDEEMVESDEEKEVEEKKDEEENGNDKDIKNQDESQILC